MKCLLLSVLVVFLLTTNGNAQESKLLHPNTPIKSMVFNQWTAEDGLVSNNLTSVRVDMQGFIWITFFYGAMKFDGANLELKDSEELSFLNSNAFMDAFFVENKSSWFSTQASGIIEYKNGEFKQPFFSNKEALPSYVRKVYVDNKGIIWAGANSL